MIPNIPFEIIEQILVRVPARSLLRFNLVCKQWRSLISDPRFVKNHLNHILLDDRNLHHRVVGINYNNLFSLQSVDDQSLNIVDSNFQFSVPDHSYIYGNCNGLLLLGKYDFDNLCGEPGIRNPVIWNPLFRDKYTYLPPPRGNLIHSQTEFIGFGYDSSNDDYKVVRLSYEFRFPRLEVEIYSLKTNSWRILPFSIPYANICVDDIFEEGIHIRGSIYWYVMVSKIILAFDLITEKYKFIETPYGRDDEHKYYGFSLCQVRGCLAMYDNYHFESETVIFVWNEDENGWTKLLSLPTKDRMDVSCLSSVNDNELLLYEDYREKRNIVVCDLANMEFRDIPVAVGFGSPMHMLETLVSPIAGGDGLKQISISARHSVVN